MRLRLLEKFDNNGAVFINIRGTKCSVKVYKSSEEYGGTRYWGLKIKMPGGTLDIPDLFWYESGYDQGRNNSMQYYLYTKTYGSAGNGGGLSGQYKPELSYRLLDHFSKILSSTSSDTYYGRLLDELGVSIEDIDKYLLSDKKGKLTRVVEESNDSAFDKNVYNEHKEK
jgi:hypothetical protein